MATAQPGSKGRQWIWDSLSGWRIGALALLLAAGLVAGAAKDETQEDEPQSPPDTHATAADSGLCDAIRANNAAAVRASIQAGADVNAEDSIGYRPLAAACKQYRSLKLGPAEARETNRQILKMLLDAGADPNIHFPGRGDPLLLYVRRSRAETELFEWLLQHGANPNVQDRNWPLFATLIIENDLRFAQLLIKYRADVNCTFESNVTIYGMVPTNPLQYALLMSDVHSFVTSAQPNPAVQILLAAGANPNLCDAKGNTALHYAIILNRQSTTIEALLNGGADPSIRNNDGELPLTRALDEQTANLLASVTPSATQIDIAIALEKGLHSATIGLHQVATKYTSPLWLAVWLTTLLLGTVWLRNRRGTLARERTIGGLSIDRPRRHHRRKTPAEGNSEPASLAQSRKEKDLRAVRLERLRARFLRMRLFAMLPLALWSAAWVPFFFDPYLRVLGLTVNLIMLGGGLLLTGFVANLFAHSEFGRLPVAVLGMVSSITAAGWCLYWTWLFYHFHDLSLALLFAATATAAGGLCVVFWNSFSVHWLLWRVTRNSPKVHLTAADDWEVGAGWDKGGL